MSKICTHLCIFNQDKWLEKHINMIGKYVDLIIISYSDFPWNYNPQARNQFKNKFNPDSLKDNKYYNKIEFIKGHWDLDEQQRNSCLEVAKAKGFDYMLILDADEFLSENDLEKLIKGIEDNPDYETYHCPWVSYWKTYDYIVIDQDNNPIVGYPEICINLHHNNYFVRCRRPSGNKVFRLDSLIHHMSYVLNDNQCFEKLSTWGHSNEFNVQEYYNNIWLNWNENTLNLHPVNPPVWKQAVKHNYILPEILR